jgi:caffeoyl-CoA O-methyltransferase
VVGHAKSFFLTDEIYAYLLDHNRPVDKVLAALAEETLALGPIAGMQIAPEQGAFMTMMVQAIGAQRAIEVGTFTGYSSICIARGLGPNGRLICCDLSDEWTEMARRYWEQAGLTDRIELRLGPAADTLRALPADEPIDFAFIDADKPSYPIYLEELVRLVRPNGLIFVDNVLQRGHVLDPAPDNPNYVAIKAFNDLVAEDERVDLVMLAISDGLTILRKR